jgi:hypothetical protein
MYRIVFATFKGVRAISDRVRPRPGSSQFWNPRQIVGDEIEQEVGGDAGNPAVLGLAQGAVLPAIAENAFDRRPAALRHLSSEYGNA